MGRAWHAVGTLWATCNVGAVGTADYGFYFAWGETEQKTTFNWSTYKYANGSSSKITKYCDNANFGDDGFIDTFTVFLSEDDAATANWGNGWRMPTNTEPKELNDNCNVTLTTQNGVNGCLFTASNGNSLFLPASGFGNGGIMNIGSIGCCWSSSLEKHANSYDARRIVFEADYFGIGICFRCFGLSVRPVCSLSQK